MGMGRLTLHIRLSVWEWKGERHSLDCCISAFQTHKKRVCYAIKGIMCKAFTIRKAFVAAAAASSPISLSCCLVIFPRHTTELNYVQSVIRRKPITNAEREREREIHIIVVHAMSQCVLRIQHSIFLTFHIQPVHIAWHRIRWKSTKNTLFSAFPFSILAFINIFVLMCVPFSYTLSKEFQFCLWGFFLLFFFLSRRFQRTE